MLIQSSGRYAAVDEVEKIDWAPTVHLPSSPELRKDRAASPPSLNPIMPLSPLAKKRSLSLPTNESSASCCRCLILPVKTCDASTQCDLQQTSVSTQCSIKHRRNSTGEVTDTEIKCNCYFALLLMIH